MFCFHSFSQLPYQLPQRQSVGGAGAPPGGGGVKYTSQLSHPLEGVVFHLSPKLATGTQDFQK